jgi:hypothetical protein
MGLPNWAGHSLLADRPLRGQVRQIDDVTNEDFSEPDIGRDATFPSYAGVRSQFNQSVLSNAIDRWHRGFGLLGLWWGGHEGHDGSYYWPRH